MFPEPPDQRVSMLKQLLRSADVGIVDIKLIDESSQEQVVIESGRRVAMGRRRVLLPA